MRTHQGPVFILFHPTHKQVWNPESKEQVSSTVLLSSSVLPTIEVLENVGMPWLQINCKGSRTLTNSTDSCDITTELNQFTTFLYQKIIFLHKKLIHHQQFHHNICKSKYMETVQQLNTVYKT